MMKYSIFIFVILGFYMTNYHADRRHDEVMQVIERRAHLDSLYWNHLEGCSFIDKDSVYIDKRGFVRIHIIK